MDRRLEPHGASAGKRILRETRRGLEKEIDYYRKTNRIVPSARRISDPFNGRERPFPMPGKREGHP